MLQSWIYFISKRMIWVMNLNSGNNKFSSSWGIGCDDFETSITVCWEGGLMDSESEAYDVTYIYRALLQLTHVHHIIK